MAELVTVMGCPSDLFLRSRPRCSLGPPLAITCLVQPAPDDITREVMERQSRGLYGPLMDSAVRLGSTGVGELLRSWRLRRRLSQLDLGLAADVSTKHVSFIETGRASPSREMVLHLADRLEVPMRERNVLLLAAGYAPRYAETPLDAETMASVRRAVQMTLDHHEPFPAVVVDRRWNVITANGPASLFTADVDPDLLEPPINVIRISLHPSGLAPHVVNFAEYASHLVSRLRRQVEQSADRDLEALLHEVSAYPNVLRSLPAAPQAPGVILPLMLDAGGSRLSLFSTIATFGTPLDITTAELAIEAFFPADEATERAFRRSDG